METKGEFLDAVKAGDVERVRERLERDPTLARARDETGVSALLLALYHRRGEVAAALRPAASPLDVFEAAAVGDAERLRQLLAAQPDLASAFSPDGFFPLGLSCFFSQPECARILVEAGADVRAAARNPMRVTALHAAAASGQMVLVELLLERGADPDARQQLGWTALHAAAAHGDAALARALLAHGADPALRNDEGADALALAREKGHREIVELLEGGR